MLASSIKRGLLIAVTLPCCASASYAQFIPDKTIKTTTVSFTKAVNSDQVTTLIDATYSSVGYELSNTKVLYEQAFTYLYV